MPEPSSVHRFAYRAFISYSHRDKAWADWLHKALETYRVPSRLVGTQTAHGIIPHRLNPIFRDRDELSSSPELGTKINEALSRSENLVVICSPASAASRWVNEEVLAYKRMGRGERIFCLIVEGEPDATDTPGREAQECFCPALRFRLGADGQPTTERTEPIAADARPGKDGKPNARLKLIAGMLDVGFDALKQREQRRQLQRMSAIASLALVVMTVTVVLAVFALISRHHAVVAQHAAVLAQHKAEVAQQSAVRRQKQAEGLVDFMLGDLTEKLEAESRGDILLRVDDKAMAYFQSLPETDVNDMALSQRAATLEKIGDVRMRQGQPAGALQAFRASTAISSRLAAAAPRDVDRQWNYARTVTYIGLIHQDMGKLDEAQREYRTAQDIFQSALKLAPGNPDLLQESTYTENNLGDVYRARGQLAAARNEYDAILVTAQKLIAAHPDWDGARESLDYAHENLADLATEQGDLATAIAQRHAGSAVAVDANKSIPNDTDMRNLMVRAYTKFVGTALLIGDQEGGLSDLKRAIAAAEQLALKDPKDTDLQENFGIALLQQARAQSRRGNLRGAIASGNRAFTVFSALNREHPGIPYLELDLAETQIEQALQLRATGGVEPARARVQAALHLLEPQLATHPDREWLVPVMQARLLLASVTVDPQVAQSLREQALQTMQAVKSGRDDPRLLALQVEALLALDRKADARPLIKQLWTEGYRDADFVAVLRQARVDYPANPAFQARLAAATRPIDGHAASPEAVVGDRQE